MTKNKRAAGGKRAKTKTGSTSGKSVKAQPKAARGTVKTKSVPQAVAGVRGRGGVRAAELRGAPSETPPPVSTKSIFDKAQTPEEKAALRNMWAFARTKQRIETDAEAKARKSQASKKSTDTRNHRLAVERGFRCYEDLKAHRRHERIARHDPEIIAALDAMTVPKRLTTLRLASGMIMDAVNEELQRPAVGLISYDWIKSRVSFVNELLKTITPPTKEISARKS